MKDENKTKEQLLKELVDARQQISQLKEIEKVEGALYAITDAVNKVKNMKALYITIHKIIQDLMPARNFYIALYDPYEEIISWPYFVDENTPAEQVIPRKRRKGITEYVLNKGKSLLITEQEFLKLSEEGDIDIYGEVPVQWLGTPLNVEKETVGVLAVQTYSDEVTLTKNHLKMLEFVSTGIALSIKRKRAERALQESEEKYRAIFENAVDSIVLVDAESGELVEFNDRAHKNLGYTHEEFQKLRIPDFETIESTEEVKKHIVKIVKEGFDTFETKHRTKNGDIRDIQVRSTAISIGEKTFIQSIWRDITEQKKTEEEQKALIEELQKALEKIKTLRGLIPICAWCHRIRDDEGFWKQVELYISEHSEVEFSHAICPDCAKEHLNQKPSK